MPLSVNSLLKSATDGRMFLHRLIAQMGPVSGKTQAVLEEFMQLRSSDPTEPVTLPKARIAACPAGHLKQHKDRPVLAAQRLKLQAHREVLAACQA